MEAEGLVVNVPNRGPVVRTLTATEAEDLYQVRGLLEGLAGRLFAQRASDEEVAQLRSALDALQAKLAVGDSGVIAQGPDRPFYDVMIRGCRNQTVSSVLHSLHNRIVLLRATTLGQPGRASDTLAELSRIVEAIEQRDADAAWQACVDHVERAAEVAVRALVRTGHEQISGSKESAAADTHRVKVA